MNELKNVRKPTLKEIEGWVSNQLDSDAMKRVTAGLLIYKDTEIQDHLQKCLLQGKKAASSATSEIFSPLRWIKDSLKTIVSSSLYSTLSLSFTNEPPKPLCLNAGTEEEDDKILEKEYTLHAESTSDLKLLIRLPKGKYLVTTIFANSKEEMGFLYPDVSNIASLKDWESLIIGGDASIPIIPKGRYTLEEDEVNLIVTQCSATKEHLQSFVTCVQEMEELGVIRWLRYIKKSSEGDFHVANLRICLKKKQ